MKRKRKPRARRRPGHYNTRTIGIVSTPIRRAIEALLVPRLNGSWQWYCPTMSEMARRLSGGRVSQSLVRHWANGTRGAPRWFVDVLSGEIDRQIEERRAILDALAVIAAEAGDRRRSPQARARGFLMSERQRQEKRASEAAQPNEPGKNDP